MGKVEGVSWGIAVVFFFAGNFTTLDSLLYSAQQNAMISPPTFPDR